MNIFEIVNNQVTWSPQALMLKPFRKIWDSDKDKEKFNATLELSYVYYMADERSDYMYILNEQERHEAVALALNLDKWKKPKYIDPAIEFYKEVSETTSTKLLQSTRGVIEKISEFLDDINLEERDQRTQKPIHDITKITAAVEKIPKLIRALNEIEKEIIKEKELKAQSGNKIVGLFDDNEGI